MTTNQAEEKMIKARIKLQARNPFFSYLSLFLKFVIDKNNRLPMYAGMGVSPDGTLTYKEDWVNGLNDEETIGVLCLTPNTLIEGEKTKKIKDIKTGDLILNKNGKLEKVGKIFKRKVNENIYDIKPQNMLPIQTTKEHPFLVKQYINPKLKKENKGLKEQFKNVKEKWINTEDIKENDLIAIPKIKGTFNKKKIDLKEFYPKLIQRQTHIIPNFNLNKKTAWLLGLYVADGSKGDRSLRFCLNNTTKKEYFNKLKNILKTEFKITHTNIFQNKTDKGKSLEFCSTLLTNAFDNFCGSSAKDKKIPHFILYNKDKEILKSFLEGYGNGDGFYYKKQKQMQFGTVSKVLAQQLQLAYLRLGKLAHIYNYKRDGVYHKIRNTILKNLNNFQIIVKNERKKVTFIDDKNCVWVKVKKITKEKYKGYVHNFETIKTHTYTANNMILHNCHEILHLAFLHLVRRGNRDGEKWNIAVDLAVNSTLKENGFELPKGGIIPQNNMFDFPMGLFKKAFKIVDINKKTAEEIYEELPELNYQNGNGYSKGNGQGNLKVKCNGFDKHEEENQDKDGKSKGKPSQAEKQELENEWLNRLEEAYVSAKQRGKLPMGMERYIDEIKKSQINWRVMLQKLIQATIPRDYTWCLDENTKIKTLNGDIKIKDLRKGRAVIGYKNGKLVKSKIKDKFSSEVKEEYIIKTKNNEIKCSPNHRILTMKGYKKAKDLIKSDIILSIKK